MRETFTTTISFKAINSGLPLLRIIAYSLWLLKPNHSSEVFSLSFERLVMSSPNSLSSSSSLSSFSPSSSTIESLGPGNSNFAPLKTFVRVDDPEGAADWVRSYLRVVPSFGIWLGDLNVIGFTFVYLDSSSIYVFVDKHNILKPDADDNILAIDYCHPANTICIGRSPPKTPFFFVYSCIFFSDLHVTFPFDDFTMGVIQALSVAFSQLHPNTWASLQTFRLICDIFRFSSTPSTFLHYYTSHPADPVS